jgi:hypothetical protein
MAQQFMSKLNANEKQVVYGAIIVLVAFLVGLVSGYGYLSNGSGDLAAAVAIVVIYWLKYQPNPINWPIPPQTLVVAIAAVSALFAVLAVLGWIGVIGTSLISLFTIAIVLNAIGCGVMAYFAWNEYQAMPKAAPPPPPAPPAA